MEHLAVGTLEFLLYGRELKISSNNWLCQGWGQQWIVPKKISDDQKEISDILNHKLDDQKRYPGKLETHNIAVVNTPAMVPQGVKMEHGDPEQNHQSSAAILKQRNTGIKKILKAHLQETELTT